MRNECHDSSNYNCIGKSCIIYVLWFASEYENADYHNLFMHDFSRGSYSRSQDHADVVLDGAFRNPRDMETEIMDEHMAAMVLTSLSCSPVSPIFPASLTDKGMFMCN